MCAGCACFFQLVTHRNCFLCQNSSKVNGLIIRILKTNLSVEQKIAHCLKADINGKVQWFIRRMELLAIYKNVYIQKMSFGGMKSRECVFEGYTCLVMQVTNRGICGRRD